MVQTLFLKFILEKAEEYEIAVHCWVNPYRVSYDSDIKNLPSDSPARKLYNEDKNSLIICEKGIFLNPAISIVSKINSCSIF